MKSLTGIMFGAAALLAAQPAWAQLATNSDAPVDITADDLEVVQSKCLSVWSGSAEALQDNSRLRANVLRTYMAVKPKGAASAGVASTSACGELVRMEAEGSVYYVTPDQRVRANAATYEASTDTITMIGDVVAVQGQNVLRGDRMVFNNKTGQGQMQGAGKGGKNRPRGVFYPKQADANAAAPKPDKSR